jgi:hypothetical protein
MTNRNELLQGIYDFTTSFIKVKITIILLIACTINGFGALKTYSTPGDLTNVPHLKESSDYTVKVNGQSSFVYESDNSWDGGGKASIIKFQDKVSFTNFDFKDETVNVEVTCNFPVNNVTIRPKIDNICFKQKGNTISFSLSKSKYLSIEVNDRKRPLFLFADSLETVPKADIVYGPGIHTIGTKFPVTSNQTIYIAGGAVVVGSFLSSGSNLKILGRGILNAGTVNWAEWKNDKTTSPLSTPTKLTAFELSGITIVNSPGWHVNAYGENTKFVDLKCIAWAGMTDGPHLNGTSLMQHCFIFNNDDALISNQRDDNTFRDCIVWKGNYGHCMISLNDNSQRNLLWEDIDIIGDEANLDFRVGKTMCITTRDNSKAVKENFTFRNIRIEGQLPDKAGIIYLTAKGSAVIKNVTFENITTELLRTSGDETEGSINQSTEASIDGVHFKGLFMNGKLINSLEEAHVKVIGDVKNIDFDNSVYQPKTIKNIKTKKVK